MKAFILILITAVILFIVYLMYTAKKNDNECKAKGGTYLSRDHICIKADIIK